jgi:hypothetical protein
MKIEFHDIIALTLLVGFMAMRFLGIDHLVDYVIVAIISFYFGLKLPTPTQNGNKA